MNALIKVFFHLLEKNEILHLFLKKVLQDQKAIIDWLLPIISKIFEKLLSKQIIMYMDKFLSKYQCGFRKADNAQHCLLAMIEKWKKALDNGNVFGALLRDFS